VLKLGGRVCEFSKLITDTLITDSLLSAASRSLPGAKTDSLEEEALKAKKHQDDGQDHQTRCRHHQVELNSMHCLEEREPEGESIKMTG
jgi:hypothetical protein